METLSDFSVELVAISEINPHPNADRLSLAKVKGWQVIIQKDVYKVGDYVFYAPVDSVLSLELETILFGPESKIKLNNSRIRAIKIRSVVSQGMIIDPKMRDIFLKVGDPQYGKDYSKELGIHKYEPPTPAFQQGKQGAPASKKQTNPNFKVYSKFPRLQNHPTMFGPEDDVVVTEKIHGTNFRAGWVPYVATNWWRKLLKLVGYAPKWQFVYGSHYTQLTDKLLYNGFYDKNVYAEAVVNFYLKDKITKGDVLYGEIYGEGIQKNYTYPDFVATSCVSYGRSLICFDIKRGDKYLDYAEFVETAAKIQVPTTPVLFKGKFKDADLDKLCQGPSVLAPAQKVREGAVVRTLVEPVTEYRQVAKLINPEYLLDTSNTDSH